MGRALPAEGVDGLRDRSSKPLSSPSQTPLATADAVEALRRQRRTQEHIAAELGISKATVSRILKRRGLSLLSSLEPQQPRPRYERETPGEIIHIDIKKLGRFNAIGHRITGDRTRPEQAAQAAPDGSSLTSPSTITPASPRADIFPDEKKESAVAFLSATVAYFKSLGVTVDRVMTDNGSCYRSNAFARACKRLGIKHIRTKPYTPQTNGKAERFIQTALARMGLRHRLRALRPAPPGALAHGCIATTGTGPMLASHKKPPISRLGLTRNNLLRLHS